MSTQYSPINPTGGTPRQVAHGINLLLNGRNNAVGSFTASAGSVDVADERIGPSRVVLLMPTSAAAQAATIAISQVAGEKKMTVSFPVAPSGTETFKYVVFG